ncbi:HTH-type transcriptional regulator EthR [Mycobacteroides abscessus subsp. massiliense]|nr:HTH-type transcriptional regulator EthR [Mycobacteroides abscessus subsp. massiliense]SKK32028.1 HTH-type transcriptional regulator EthR [Mycobacteroides abscessus subsp. massiliense]SKK49280.1 HTH-type transcriptional regulator EthR [Mycobacteroides abscessus subsp. massiliense]SKR66909.1 HTH-type transcriptional regulator EthR [Mycobacteroides abscessus subsp. massiliense]SKS93795.1 HTH-type transcriptional regulator EthR [Mycobacteroides abscessus subsp. massiliense]
MSITLKNVQVDVTKPATRGRKTTRPSGDERIQAILATAEELLGQRPLADVSVDDLARGAGISRPTFYFYFSSKEAVLLTLAERIIEEADANVASIDPAAMTSPAQYWRAVIKAYFDAFGSHRALTVALSSMQGTSPELDQRWSEVTENWVANTTVGIEAERARGAAPSVVPARDIAIALNLINQAMMRATFTGQQPAVDDGKVVDTLLHVWLNAIYGGVCANS